MPSLEILLIAVLAVLLAVVSGLAGVLWARARTRPLVEVAHLAETLAVRLRTLDSVLARLEPARSPKSPAEPRTDLLSASPSRRLPRSGVTRRLDPAHASAVAGPTLIAVPDLAASAEPTAAATELASRFGAIWELADTGASADAIARGTGQPIGQVELILGLRRQLETATTGSPAS